MVLKLVSDDPSGVFDVCTLLKAIQVHRGGRPWVCGCWLAGIAGSNPTGSMGFLFLFCVLSGSFFCNSPIPRPGKTYRVRARARARVRVCVSMFVSKLNNNSKPTISRWKDVRQINK